MYKQTVQTALCRSRVRAPREHSGFRRHPSGAGEGRGRLERGEVHGNPDEITLGSAAGATGGRPTDEHA